MIDVGLLLSAIIAVGVPTLLASRWSFDGADASVDFSDVVLGPLLVGVAVARLVAVLLDDPGSLGRPTDLLIIRSGVEFWPGALAAAGLLALSARRAGGFAMARLAGVAPLALVGLAGYEATCVVRDGCFGPESPVGLRPAGVSTTMLPIGWVMALALVGAAIGLRHWTRPADPWLTIVVATLAAAAVRSIGSIWLPHLGDGVTRAHATSIGVTGLATIALIVMIASVITRGADREEGRRHPPPDRREPF